MLSCRLYQISTVISSGGICFLKRIFKNFQKNGKFQRSQVFENFIMSFTGVIFAMNR